MEFEILLKKHNELFVGIKSTIEKRVKLEGTVKNVPVYLKAAVECNYMDIELNDERSIYSGEEFGINGKGDFRYFKDEGNDIHSSQGGRFSVYDMVLKYSKENKEFEVISEGKILLYN